MFKVYNHNYTLLGSFETRRAAQTEANFYTEQTGNAAYIAPQKTAKPVCVYWAHSRREDPSKIFRLKREAIAWARDTFDGIFIVEPINKAKLSEKLAYIEKQFGITPELAYTGRSQTKRG